MQRTYVRRRRMAAATLLVAVLAVGSPVARAVAGSSDAGASRSRSGASADAGTAETAVHVVAEGDTLWSIAAAHDPSRDPRAVVHEITSLNGLGDEPLVPGRPLQLPATS